MVPAPSSPVLAALALSGWVAIAARHGDDGELAVSTAPHPLQEGPLLARAWAHSAVKAEGIAERLRRDLASLNDPEAFLAAFERLAVIAGARLHRVVIAEAEEQAGVAA